MNKYYTPKTHAAHTVSHSSSAVRTLCGLHIGRGQIAAFEGGVTCRVCLKAIEWSRFWNAQGERLRERIEEGS